MQTTTQQRNTTKGHHQKNTQNTTFRPARHERNTTKTPERRQKDTTNTTKVPPRQSLCTCSVLFHVCYFQHFGSKRKGNCIGIAFLFGHHSAEPSRHQQDTTETQLRPRYRPSRQTPNCTRVLLELTTLNNRFWEELVQICFLS